MMSAPRIARMKSLLRFPLTRIAKDGTKLRIDRIDDNKMSSAYEIFMKYSESGKGIGQDTFKSEDDFRKRIIDSACFYCENTDTGEVVGIFNLTPSPLARSLTPIVHAGYIVLDPSMLQKGYGYELMAIYWVVGRSLGYRGISGRTSSMNPSILTTMRKVNMEFNGYIPSSYQADGLWYDDCLCSMDTANINLSTEEDELFEHVRKSPEIPPSPEATSTLTDTWILEDYEGVQETLSAGRRVGITQATQSDRCYVDQLIHEDALEATGGFALDELFSDGTWSRKLLYKSCTLVMKASETGEKMAAAVIGPSAISRSQSPVSLGIYVIVEHAFRRQGAATSLVQEATRIAKDRGFNLCISDVYSINTPAIRLAHRLGYSVCASVPKSGYFERFGHVDTLLYYRNIKQFNISDRVLRL